MRKRIILILTLFASLLCLVQPAGAEMQSSTYRIPTSIFSGGGAPMSSSNYQTNSTLSQPTPLIDTANLPYSDNYENYPGFWYTIDLALARGKAMPWILLLLLDD